MRALLVLILLVLGGALALPAGEVDAASDVERVPVIEVVEDLDPDVAATTPPDHGLPRAPRVLATAGADDPQPAHSVPPPVPPPRR